jgi:hypothetical protein
VGKEGEEMMDERLPPSRSVVEGTGRGAAGPLGRVVVVVRGRRGGGGRDELVGEDGGGPLAAHYSRHGGPRPRLGLTAPPIRPSLAASLLAPAGAGHHRVRWGPAGDALLTRRSTAGRGARSGAGSGLRGVALEAGRATAAGIFRWGMGWPVWLGFDGTELHVLFFEAESCRVRRSHRLYLLRIFFAFVPLFEVGMECLHRQQ